MANLTVYSVQKLEQNDYKIFMGLYNDFKNRAKSDFKFELEPLEYEDFTKAIENKLLKCIVLTENSIPTGFLIYTDVISFSIELNMIYLISDENYETKVRYLIGEFFTQEADVLKEKVVTYPLLGEQVNYKETLREFGFQGVSQTVLKFDLSNPSCITKLNSVRDLKPQSDHIMTNWDEKQFDKVVKLIHNNFKYTNDASFDPRFRTYEGVKDIITKITNSVYGEFLPQYTKMVHKDFKIIGICFVNVTGDGIVNIPLVAVEKQYRNKKLGKKMVSLAVKDILETKINEEKPYKEVNVTTDTFNPSSVKMYESCGFITDYEYQQCYYEAKGE